MKPTPPKCLSVKPNKTVTKLELTMLNQKLMMLLKLSDPSEIEEETSKNPSKPEKKPQSYLMNKKKMPELKELKTPKTSLPDKNKPLKYSMPLRLLFQNSKLSLHTPPLKLSWNQPNLDHPTQLPLLLKLLHLLMLMLFKDVLDSLKNYKPTLPYSLMMISKTKFKLKLILIDS